MTVCRSDCPNDVRLLNQTHCTTVDFWFKMPLNVSVQNLGKLAHNEEHIHRTHLRTMKNTSIRTLITFPNCPTHCPTQLQSEKSCRTNHMPHVHPCALCFSKASLVQHSCLSSQHKYHKPCSTSDPLNSKRMAVQAKLFILSASARSSTVRDDLPARLLQLSDWKQTGNLFQLVPKMIPSSPWSICTSRSQPTPRSHALHHKVVEKVCTMRKVIFPANSTETE